LRIISAGLELRVGKKYMGLRFGTLKFVAFDIKNNYRPIPYISHTQISLIWPTFSDIAA